MPRFRVKVRHSLRIAARCVIADACVDSWRCESPADTRRYTRNSMCPCARGLEIPGASSARMDEPEATASVEILSRPRTGRTSCANRPRCSGTADRLARPPPLVACTSRSSWHRYGYESMRSPPFFGSVTVMAWWRALSAGGFPHVRKFALTAANPCRA